MQYVYVFDYCNPSLIEIELLDDNLEEYEIVSDIFDRLGLKENQCHWMITEERLRLEQYRFES